MEEELKKESDKPQDEPKKCWEFWNCTVKENCAVYQNDMGNECWLLMNLKRGCPASKKYDGCFNCPWYKRLNK